MIKPPLGKTNTMVLPMGYLISPIYFADGFYYHHGTKSARRNSPITKLGYHTPRRYRHAGHECHTACYAIAEGYCRPQNTMTYMPPRYAY